MSNSIRRKKIKFMKWLRKDPQRAFDFICQNVGRGLLGNNKNRWIRDSNE